MAASLAAPDPSGPNSGTRLPPWVADGETCRTRSSPCDTLAACPVLSPARAVLTRVPLGPRPLLHQLRGRSPVVVRRLRRCRVGGGRAFALPPSARSNGSCGFPASRFPVCSSPLTGDDDPPASPGGLRVSSMAAQGLSLCELVRTSAMYSPARRASTLPHSTGPSPSGRPFGSDRRRRSSGSDPGPFALTPFLSTLPRSDSWHRFGRNFACASIRPYPRGLQAGLFVACFSPFRLRVSHDSGHTFPMDDTRPPWVTDALPHRVARPHLGATGRNPGAFAPIVRARPFPVFGRPVHRSGSLPLITTRWFSSSLSDPASRRAPCPPEHRRWWLQVGLSVSRLSPSCLTSLSIPSIHSGR